tara:strand:+ start:6412 stop:10362 length:3951 start_codon:yes stop_codon:yes gene_type:complete
MKLVGKKLYRTGPLKCWKISPGFLGLVNYKGKLMSKQDADALREKEREEAKEKKEMRETFLTKQEGRGPQQEMRDIQTGAIKDIQSGAAARRGAEAGLRAQIAGAGARPGSAAGKRALGRAAEAGVMSAGARAADSAAQAARMAGGIRGADIGLARGDQRAAASFYTKMMGQRLAREGMKAQIEAARAGAQQSGGGGKAAGGAIYKKYAKGGEYPRRQGKIEGPGTEESDSIKAKLSDGEFVVNSATVRGLGKAMGAKGKKESREKGSSFLYKLQAKYGKKEDMGRNLALGGMEAGGAMFTGAELGKLASDVAATGALGKNLKGVGSAASAGFKASEDIMAKEKAAAKEAKAKERAEDDDFIREEKMKELMKKEGGPEAKGLRETKSIMKKAAGGVIHTPVKAQPEDVLKKRKAKGGEVNPRIPRKKGQPAKSKKHSDLYTDEDPKGTIHGLGFKDVAKAKSSVSKISKSSRSHAHKVQAAVAMEQRAREMGKSPEAAVYRKFINKMKEKTKKISKAKGGEVEYKKGGELNKKEEVKKQIVKELKKASKMHKSQAERLNKLSLKYGGKVEYNKGGGVKPDFLDVDKDGDKKESMKKAFKEKNMKHGGKVHYNKGGKVKPDFLDVDKDGDKKESMKKAFKEKNMKHGGKVHYNKGGKVKLEKDVKSEIIKNLNKASKMHKHDAKRLKKLSKGGGVKLGKGVQAKKKFNEAIGYKGNKVFDKKAEKNYKEGDTGYKNYEGEKSIAPREMFLGGLMKSPLGKALVVGGLAAATGGIGAAAAGKAITGKALAGSALKAGALAGAQGVAQQQQQKEQIAEQNRQMVSQAGQQAGAGMAGKGMGLVKDESMSGGFEKGGKVRKDHPHYKYLKDLDEFMARQFPKGKKVEVDAEKKSFKAIGAKKGSIEPVKLQKGDSKERAELIAYLDKYLPSYKDVLNVDKVSTKKLKELAEGPGREREIKDAKKKFNIREKPELLGVAKEKILEQKKEMDSPEFKEIRKLQKKGKQLEKDEKVKKLADNLRKARARDDKAMEMREAKKRFDERETPESLKVAKERLLKKRKEMESDPDFKEIKEAQKKGKSLEQIEMIEGFRKRQKKRRGLREAKKRFDERETPESLEVAKQKLLEKRKAMDSDPDFKEIKEAQKKGKELERKEKSKALDSLIMKEENRRRKAAQDSAKQDSLIMQEEERRRKAAKQNVKQIKDVKDSVESKTKGMSTKDKVNIGLAIGKAALQARASALAAKERREAENRRMITQARMAAAGQLGATGRQLIAGGAGFEMGGSVKPGKKEVLKEASKPGFKKGGKLSFKEILKKRKMRY